MKSFHSSISRVSMSRSLGAGSLTVRARPNYGQKYFATSGPSSQQATPKWVLGFVGLGVPITYYLWTRNNTKKPNTTVNERGANQEYTQSAEGNQKNGTSGHDEPRAMGPPGGTGSMSSKQQGLSNADTMNPYVNEPGKSEKGEGETETAKVKGTVRTDRPQV